MTLSRTFVLHDHMDAQALWAFLRRNWKALARQGRPLSVCVSEYRAKRTTEQNKRYWAILNEIAENAWIDGNQFSAEVWAEFFKGQFIGFEETPDGRQIGLSTTYLSVEEFSVYMNKIEAYAVTELGVIFEH